VNVVAGECERHLIQAGGFLERELLDRPLRCTDRVRDRPLGVTARQRCEEVVRQLGEVGLEIIGVEALEGLADPGGAAERDEPP